MSSFESIPLLLQTELQKRKANDTKYSLRQFARDIGVPPSSISELIAGKRNVSNSLARRIFTSLGVDAPDLPKSESSTDGLRRVKYTELDPEKKDELSSWEYFAVLSLFETSDFVAKPEWMAKRLNLKTKKVREIITKLHDTGCLRRDAKGRSVLTGASFSTSDGDPNLALRKAHKHFLAQAAKSLEIDPVDKRDFTAFTMSIDPHRLAEAKIMVRKFGERLCRFLEGGDKKEVYRMSFNLIPLSHRRDEDVKL